ncbi:sugar transferase [Halomonas sp. MCCC 1A17488]|uniref:Sugar transferase n=1 Tax=Billgrantia sulfidoxydans TaxID=2733484 RepID=A0ABX7VY59_9GAMM|nr:MULTISPECIES: sugar transferase [Halomonas]MCE8017066.1 sugar transferase [Halomonas sp. MCCC 1A17488]MCG3240399.1 sugar transferase [Halomonas sp. MCCC 1A17488]QPP49737.1 sugar transferase [Halomonas sp. SS10-MC5]QTP53348.1 sugar transferase [Halomonas sulfidoxydans]
MRPYQQHLEAPLPRELGLTPAQRFLKRAFDLVLAAALLLLLLPLILVAAWAAARDTQASGFFVQERVGRDGRPFRVIKLRTMRPQAGTSVTTLDDPRITRLGRILRRSKLDELPQLFNVLAGHMSFVGPRPDVPGFADLLDEQDRVILAVRPGITGPATLKYRDEERLLAGVADPERYNREVIFPDKVRLNRDYVLHWSFGRDLGYLWRTLFPSGNAARSEEQPE